MLYNVGRFLVAATNTRTLATFSHSLDKYLSVVFIAEDLRFAAIRP